MHTWHIGVDEAGRGPLAGPVAVGVVMAPRALNLKTLFPGLADSKLVTEANREDIYRVLAACAAKERITFCVRFSGVHTIDEKGITIAVQRAVSRGVRSLAEPETNIKVLLDGLLHAPEEYEQETIIRGDATEPIISLASIVAKVRRDRLMRTLERQFPEYGFAAHKGYGTKAHLASIRRHGLSEIHRKTFCRNTQ